ncbi:protein DEK [Syngnathus typhle]
MLNSDPQLSLAHQLHSVCLHKSPPQENRWHMAGEPQQKEDQEQREIPNGFTDPATIGMATTARSVNAERRKWKTNPGAVRTTQGKGKLKRRRPTPSRRTRESPITKKRKMNPKEPPTTESSNESTAKPAEPNVKTTSRGALAKRKIPKRKRTRNTYSARRRRNQSARKLKAANTGEWNNQIQPSSEMTERSGAGNDNTQKHKDKT